MKSQIALCHLHLKRLLLRNAIRMSNALAHNVTNSSPVKVDDQGAAATEFAAAIVW